jgi:hypothetical protein
MAELQHKEQKIEVTQEQITAINNELKTINEAIEMIENKIVIAQIYSITTDMIFFKAAKTWEVDSAEIHLRTTTGMWISGGLNLTAANILLG